MATQIVLVFALFAGLACASPSSRILGGTPSSVEKHPSIVQVESMGSASGIWAQSCGGNILTARYVVSAAHCFHGIFYEPKNRRIRAGSSERNTGGVVIQVDVEINHPTYGVNDMDGDISIVRLLGSLEYSPVIQQGPIIPADFNLPDGLPVVLAGWGATELGSLPSNELLETSTYIVSREVCAERYASLSIPRSVTENMICASHLDVGGRTACAGDFGGPLYYDGILVGVLSWGEGCSNKTLPGVSTAVASYTNWIIDTAV
ncbi:trypsin, alkaline C [Helicoverpa armigera]|uniref:trypsin, alkaline C n=1 Tax=Helicoverpa armigera TaxID=29058 RepID=UPI0021112FA5|nr:trypsin, alkaline C-like [Helicoverpa armigera]